MKKLARKISIFLLVAMLLVPTVSVAAADGPDRIDGNPYRITDVEESTTQTPVVVTTTENPSSTSTATEGTTTTQVQSSGVASGNRVSYSSMLQSISNAKAINKDTQGWLVVPGSNINTPVVIGSDNAFYEKRTFEGVNYPNNDWRNYVKTADYLDYRVYLGKTWNSSSKNIVVYGHNWSNLKAPYTIGNYPQHTMFAQLASYNDINYAQQNPYIYFSTGDMEGVWKIFAVGYTETSPARFRYNSPNLSDDEFMALATEWKQRSLFNFNVDIQPSDQIITLSTCTRHYPGIADGQRYCVVARRLRDNESDSTPVNVSYNPNIKQPNFS